MTVNAKAILSLIFTVMTRYQLQISKQMAKRRQQKQMDMMITASEATHFMQACSTLALASIVQPNHFSNVVFQHIK